MAKSDPPKPVPSLIPKSVSNTVTPRNTTIIAVAIAVAANLPAALEQIPDPLQRVGATVLTAILLMVASRFLRNGH